MRELVDKLLNLNVSETTEYSELARKHGFGSAAWQEAMLLLIKKKLQDGKEITGTDRAFVETQIEHNARLKDELESMGFPGGFNVN